MSAPGHNTTASPLSATPTSSVQPERVIVQFKAELFNLTNTPRFSNPASNVSNMTINSTTGVVVNPNNFMAITGASDERKFRFGLRLSF